MKTKPTLSGGASVPASRICRRPDGSRGRSPHQSLICFALVFAATLSQAATNDLGGLLQKGLFEEEANRNLEAAAQAYQTVSAQFDKDRKLAATAIFRLGEIYRKQGQTNEAAGQYQRIVREFADQDTLVTLSRQNLAGMGSLVTITGLPKTLADEQAISRLEAELLDTRARARQAGDRLEGYNTAKNHEDMLTFVNDEALKELFRKNAELSRKFEALKAAKDRDNPELATAWKQFDENQQQLAAADQRYQELLDLQVRDLTAKAVGLQDRLDLARGLTESPGSRTPVVSLAARLEQKRLLEEEIKLTEQDLADLKMRVETGQSPPSAPRDKEREILKLRRQLAGLDVAAANTPTGQNAPPDDDEEKEIRRIQAVIQNSPDLINAPGKNNETLLQAAAGKGQLKVVQFLLNHGAEVNGNQPKNIAPLHYAAGNGHKTVVDLLLQRGAMVDSQTESGATPLYLAALKGYALVAKALIAAGAQVDTRTRRTGGWTGDHLQYEVRENFSPLDVATTQGSQQIVELLLDAKADPNAPGPGGVPPLINAAASGQKAMVQLLLDHRADVNDAAGDGGTALHRAAQNGSSETVGLLLAHKADTNLKDKKGYTPLHAAAANGKTDVAAQLIAAGADVNSTGLENQTGAATPLWLAAAGGHREVVKMLLEHGAKPNVTALAGQYGVTPLMRAAGGKDADLVALLLKYRADPNLADERGNTALSNALYTRSLEAVRALLAGGANPEARTLQGRTALIIAVAEQQDKALTAALIEAKANVNAPDPTGKTPLHFAVMINRKDLVELLLATGANANLRDNSGKTPLDIAKEKLPNVISAPPPPPMPAQAAGTTFSDRLQMAEAASVESKLTDIAALLRQHGARDDLPNLDRIEVRRPETGYSKTIFLKGTNDWNRFTLLDALFGNYFPEKAFRAPGLPFSERLVNLSEIAFTGEPAFPDLHRLVVVRASDTSGKQAQRISVDLLLPTGAVDCAKDMPLNFGDVVEILEREHTLQDGAVGLNSEKLQQIAQCRSGTVGLLVRGKRTELQVWPRGGEALVGPVLARQDARSSLFSSSDLSRVKVTRPEAPVGKKQEWLLDCSAGKTPDLWLRDGDVIEVPDKP